MQRVSEIKLNRKEFRSWWFSVLLSIVVSLALILSSSQGKKWTAASILIIMGIFSCFVLQKKLWPLLLFLIVFIIPFKIDFYLIFKPTYFIQSFGLPVTAFDVVLTILTLYLCLQVLQGKHKFRFYPSISIPALVYLVLSGISAFHSADLSLSFSVIILMIKSYIAFLFFANMIKTEKNLLLVVFALVCGVMLQSFVGWIQYLTEGGFLKGVFGLPKTAFILKSQGQFMLSRVGGTVGHPNALAKYLCFCIPVILSYVLNERSNTTIRKLAFVSMIAGCVVLIMTLSRGSWMALGLALMYFFYERFRGYSKSRSKAVAMVFLLSVMLAIATLGFSKHVRVRLFESDYGSARSRIPMAMVALNIISNHPISGVGLNNYTTVMGAYDRTREWQSYRWPAPVHNSYLLIAAESGIPALVAFFWLIIAVFTQVKPALKRLDSPVAFLQIGFLGGLMTWLISGMFDRDFAGTNIMFWFTIAMIMAAKRILSAEDGLEAKYEKQINSNWA